MTETNPNKPNATTAKAIEEGKKLLADPTSPKYSSL